MLVAMCDAALAETIHMLVSDPNPLVRAYAIAHDHATREQGNEAMSDTDAQVVKQAARKCDDPQLLSISATHEDREVRMAVASNPHTPQDALHALIRDADMWVRIRAARNPTLTLDMRMILAEDEEHWVRIVNAEETGDPRILAIAARDSDADVAARRRPKRAHRPRRLHVPVNARGRAGTPTRSLTRGHARGNRTRPHLRQGRYGTSSRRGTQEHARLAQKGTRPERQRTYRPEHARALYGHATRRYPHPRGSRQQASEHRAPGQV